MSTRTDIFARLKTTLDKVHNPTVRYSRADQHMHDAGAVLIPERGRTEGAAKTALFISEAEYALAEVRQVGRLADVPKTVAAILKAAGIAKLKAAPDETLQAMNWAGVDIAYGRGEGSDHAGLSMAMAGISETGTLVMASGPSAPTTLNFLVDVHMVVLREEDIVANYEEVWMQLRRDAPAGGPVLPRTVNWITGPSRTADIEQTMLLGAHGPRNLIILLIDGETA